MIKNILETYNSYFDSSYNFTDDSLIDFGKSL